MTGKATNVAKTAVTYEKCVQNNEIMKLIKKYLHIHDNCGNILARQ